MGTFKHLQLAGAAVGAAALMSVSACTAADPQSGSGSAGGTNGTLTINTSFVVKDLDPAQVYEATGGLAVHGMYDTLVTFEGSDIKTPKPLLAKSWKVNTTSTEFTFTLRDDAKFSDGSPITADDVVFSINRLRNLKGSPAVTVEGLTASSPAAGTVVVTSDRPNPNVPTILAMPAAGIVNSKIVEAQGGSAASNAASSDKATKYLDSNSAGSGPYVLESFDPASQIVLKANPKYWEGTPAFQRVVIKNVEAPNQKLSIEKSSGSEMALDLSGRMLDGLPDKLQTSSSQDTFYFLTAHQDPAVSAVTSNKNWVKALRASVDFKGLAALFGADAQPAAGMVPTAFPGALPASDTQEQDLATAKQDLAASGVGDRTVSLMYPAITYRGVDLGTIATKIQNDASQAGIKLQLDPQPIAAFLDAQSAGKVALRFSPQSLNPVAASLVNNFAPGQSSALRTGWTKERASQASIDAGDAVMKATNQDDQIKAIQKWQRMLNQDSPYVTLAYNSGVVVATPDLAGADYSPAGWIVDLRAVAHK